jgi:hypothetical protein
MPAELLAVVKYMPGYLSHWNPYSLYITPLYELHIIFFQRCQVSPVDYYQQIAKSSLAMSATPNITSYFNRGPLTTSFIPPTTCLQTLSRVVMYVGSSTISNTYYGHWFAGDSACYPTGKMPATLLNSPTYWGTYWCMLLSDRVNGILRDAYVCSLDSPGLYCPSGWSTAGQLAGSWNGLDVTGSTSGAICCPS